MAFFALSGLDILNSLHLVEDNKSGIIEWIYSNQKLPDDSGEGILSCENIFIICVISDQALQIMMLFSFNFASL